MGRIRLTILALIAVALIVAPMALALKVNRDPLPPSGFVGQSYSFRFLPDGGIEPYLWRVHSGAFPPGLTLNASTGDVSGVPTQPGAWNFYIELKGGSGNVTQGSFVINIGLKLTVTTGGLPDAGINAPYPGQQLQATGGTVSTWSIDSGQLPPGITLATNGAIQGTPTTSGTYEFVVRATGSAGTDTKRLSIFVLAPLQLGGPTGAPYVKEPVPLNVKVNSPFPWGIKAAGGKTPYTYSSSALPSGLTLNASDGKISGTPTLAGVYPITFTVTDALGGKDDMTATLNVKALLSFSKTAKPPVKAVGNAFRWRVPVAGASKTRFYLISGFVPPGLNLDEATGFLSGTPLQAGSYRVKLWVLGDSGTQISKSYTIKVTP